MTFLTDEQLHRQELDKVAPEGHRDYSFGLNSVWCPWAYKTVVLSYNQRAWPICTGCQRPVDIEAAKAKRTYNW